ncbi:MAG: sigma-70 family RNA polymerase sigma factor [Myxococcota bacterium]
MRANTEGVSFVGSPGLVNAAMPTPHATHARSPDDREAAWVAAARRGDRRAFARLYRRYAKMVHGILLSRVRPGDVRDLGQDVFVAALDRLANLTDDGRFGPWLASIARNCATDHLRLRRVCVPVDDGLRASTPRAPQAVEALQRILALPEPYRETMVLRLVEGMTGPEIAARTGLTAGSVRVKLCRGMKLLREGMHRSTR